MRKSRLIYLSHFLSAWGDRMWRFAVALFLMDLAPDDLQLPAIYGVTLAGTVLMFGPLVGNLIDRSPRLRAAQVSLVTQNTLVAVCAAILLVQKLYQGQSAGYLVFVKIAAVILGAVAQLASVASSIVIQKDWIVVIAGDDTVMLSKLNSMLRRIDLFTKLLAPLVCGQVMTLASITFGCAFVAGWNLLSMIVEYALLVVVYKSTPALAEKKNLKKPTPVNRGDNVELVHVDEEVAEAGKQEEEQGQEQEVQEEIFDDRDEAMIITPDNSSTSSSLPRADVEDVSKMSCIRTVFSFILVIPQGWKRYMSQTVAEAGIGMSFLYMTVMGFDSITISYAYHQCFSELLVGILVGFSAITGIVATFIFTPLSSRFGVIRTGSLASIAQVVTLIPCVISIFAPGSPFYLLPSNNPPMTTLVVSVTTYTNSYSTSALTHGLSPTTVYASPMASTNATSVNVSNNSMLTSVHSTGATTTGVSSNSTLYSVPVTHNSTLSSYSTSALKPTDASTSRTETVNSTTSVSNATSSNTTSTTYTNTTAETDKGGVFLKCMDGVPPPSSYLSLSLLMTGVILARVGLWGFDLAVTQLYQEEVLESERGIVNGVQSSLNNMMDLLHFFLVIALPDVEQFGILVILSALFVCNGHLFYAAYARKQSGLYCFFC